MALLLLGLMRSRRGTRFTFCLRLPVLLRRNRNINTSDFCRRSSTIWASIPKQMVKNLEWTGWKIADLIVTKNRLKHLTQIPQQFVFSNICRLKKLFIPFQGFCYSVVACLFTSLFTVDINLAIALLVFKSMLPQ